jgi:hypothetical protein
MSSKHCDHFAPKTFLGKMLGFQEGLHGVRDQLEVEPTGQVIFTCPVPVGSIR